MNYFVIVKGSKVGTAILEDVVKVSEHRNFVVFYADGGLNPVLVPQEWLMDYGPIEEDFFEAVPVRKPAGVEPETACQVLDGILRDLGPLTKGGDACGCNVKRDGVAGNDVRAMPLAGISPTYDDAS